MTLALRHTGIVVRDLQTMLDFYREMLGFSVVTRAEEAGAYLDNMLSLTDARVTTVKLAAPDGGMIELLKFDNPPSRNRDRCSPIDTGITHFALTVNDLDKLFERLSASGIGFEAPPQFSPDGRAKVTFCRDPEDNLIELVEELVG